MHDSNGVPFVLLLVKFVISQIADPAGHLELQKLQQIVSAFKHMVRQNGNSLLKIFLPVAILADPAVTEVILVQRGLGFVPLELLQVNYHQYDWCSSYALQNCDHHESGQYVPCSTLPSYPTPACTKTCDKEATTYTTPYASDKRHFKTEYSIPNDVTKIQTEIMTNGPVEASFSVYEDFETYLTGVYVHKTGQYLGGHAVKFIGWGVDNGTPYWTVANSWNQDWGEKGFFRIIRGVNECGIEASIVAGMYM